MTEEQVKRAASAEHKLISYNDWIEVLKDEDRLTITRQNPFFLQAQQAEIEIAESIKAKFLTQLDDPNYDWNKP